jgi:hypothetical protein
MSEPEPPTEPTAQAPVRAPPPSAATTPVTARRGWRLIAFAMVAAAFGFWGLWQVLVPAADDPRAQLRAQAAQMESQQQRIATLTRSDQISREANRDLQGTLAERDEEIAGLRADVAFYERFVGATGQRRGLTVHELRLQPLAGQAWHFTATLTQNLNRGAVSDGRVALSVEGTRAGKLQRLSWAELRQQPSAPGLDYSFKYFQQVEGDLMLPPGFAPLRVSVQLTPRGGAAVEQSFAWTEATARPGE